MQCWPDDDAADRVWEAELRRGVRRAIGAAALAAGLCGALAWAALAQAGGGWTAYPATPSLEPRPDLPATCTVDEAWAYNPACCCTHGWCAPIPCDLVRETAAGYDVRVPAGAHPRVRAPLSVLVPRGDARPSPDGRCHLCASRASDAGPGSARCLLVPAGLM
jgi:hypothetical protein